MTARIRIIFSFAVFLLFTVEAIYAQEYDYDVVEIPGNEYYFSAIELSPDRTSLALGTQKGHILIYDLASEKVTRDIDVPGFKHGPYLYFSADGKHLLLVEQFFTNWVLSKDYPSQVAVVDVASGQVLFTRSDVNAACFTPDSRQLAILTDGEIRFLNIRTGEVDRKFKPENATASFAICSNAGVIAVSHKPTEDELLKIPSVRDDKKVIKEAVKYRQLVSFYKLDNFQKAYTADDLFDIVFSMKYDPSSGLLYLYNAPNLALNASSKGSKRNGYIQIVDPTNGAVSRTMFSSNAIEPIYKNCMNHQYFAIASQEHRSTVINTVMLYDLSTGEMLKVFKNDFRLSEDKVFGRAAFEFLPDDEHIIMGYGTKLAKWKFKK